MNQETALEKAFAIVAIGGNAKGEAYEALAAAEEGRFDEADKALAQAEQDLVDAHNIQTEFILLSMIFVHAPDHLRCALEAQSLIGHLVAQAKRIDALERRVEALEGHDRG